MEPTILTKVNGFKGNRLALACRGESKQVRCNMKTFFKEGAGLIAFSVVVVIFWQYTALNSSTRFSKTSFPTTGIEDESCLSRSQSVLYRKSSPHKPSSYLIDKLRSYEELHKRCGPYTESYKKSLKQLKSGEVIDNSTGCSYVVWLAVGGLGNRMLSITSAFLYALLTNRVLLINQERDMTDLFCEPFPDTSWILPDDFPFMSISNRFKWNFKLSYGNMLKSDIINYSTELLPSYLFLSLTHDYGHHDKLFFCDQDQALLSKVPWLIMRSNQYFLPSLFLIPSFEQKLSKLFPDKETVFHHLGRYLFHPSNRVWEHVRQYYKDYLAKAEKIIGVQIRIFGVKTSPFEYVMDQILSCTQMENLLPEVDTEKSVTSPPENWTNKAVLVTSLFPRFAETLNRTYGEHLTKSGEVVAIYQPSHEGRQRSNENSHNVQAWAEMYLLSLSDELVTSAGSTFGYVAQGLRGIRPLILYKIHKRRPNPPCGRGLSMEPCYHAPPTYDCKANASVDTATLVPHVRHCEDLAWGIKLFNTMGYCQIK